MVLRFPRPLALEIPKDPVKAKQALTMYYRGLLDVEVESLKELGLSNDEIMKLGPQANPKTKGTKLRKPKRLYEHNLIEIASKWDWNGIVAELRRRSGRVPKRPPWNEFKPRYYLGNQMTIGPEKDYFEPEEWYGVAIMGKAPEYRVHEWMEALITIAGLHNLEIFRAQAAPADIYVEPEVQWGKYVSVADLTNQVEAILGKDYVDHIDKY